MSFLKGINRSACISWSPVPQQGEYIAAATVVGTTDLNFDTSGHLELFQFDASSELQIAPSAKTELPDRVQSLAWGSTGLIACGLPSGAIHFLDSNAIVNQKNDPAIATIKQHNSPVSALEFNKLQPQIMASGAEESEVFIWNLAKPESPVAYAPGVAQVNKDPISALNWNSEVPYILATLSQNGRVVVWDLRNKRPAVQFMDRRLTSARSISWNPANPMQLITASEDDHTPIIQVWNIRHTQMPTSTLTGHTQGIWSTSWSPHDASLLLSTGKENRAICWNVQDGSIVQEIELRSEWNSEIEWAPQIPATFAVSSYQGQIGVYSLHDVKRDTPDPQTGLIDYSNPPSWLRKPAGASFGFGGKLVSVHKSSVNIQSAVTRPDVVQSAETLQGLFALDDCQEYCSGRIQSASTPDEKEVWEFLRAQFDSNPRETLLSQLGFDRDQIQQAISQLEVNLSSSTTSLTHLGGGGSGGNEGFSMNSPLRDDEFSTSGGGGADSLADELALTGGSDSESTNLHGETKSETPAVDDLADLFSGTSVDDPFGGPTGGHSSLGGGKSADFFDSFGQPDDQFSFGPGTTSGFDHHGQPGGDDHHQGSFSQEDSHDHAHHHATILELAGRVTGGPISILKDISEPETLLAQALLVGDFQSAVEFALKTGSLADALALSMCSGDSALQLRTRAAYFNQLPRGSFLHLADHVEKNQLRELIARADVEEWRSTLAILCTYGDDFFALSTELGEWLLHRGLDHPALLCFICGGDLERAIAVSERTGASNSEEDPFVTLQTLVETITVFRKAPNGRNKSVGAHVISKYCEYAEILAAQGLLQSALELLSCIQEPHALENSKLSSLLVRLRASLESSSVVEEPSPPSIDDRHHHHHYHHENSPLQHQEPSPSPAHQHRVVEQRSDFSPPSSSTSQHGIIPSSSQQRPVTGPFGGPPHGQSFSPAMGGAPPIQPIATAPPPVASQGFHPTTSVGPVGGHPFSHQQNPFQTNVGPVSGPVLVQANPFPAPVGVYPVSQNPPPSHQQGYTSTSSTVPISSFPPAVSIGGDSQGFSPYGSGAPVGGRPAPSVISPYGAQSGPIGFSGQVGGVPPSVTSHLPQAPPLAPFRVPSGPGAHDQMPPVEHLPSHITGKPAAPPAQPPAPPPGLDIPDLLSAAIASHKAQYGNNPAIRKNLDGCGDDRIKVLRDRITSKSLSEESLEILRDFVQAFEKGDRAKINESYTLLNDKKFTELTGKVMLGLKKLHAIEF